MLSRMLIVCFIFLAGCAQQAPNFILQPENSVFPSERHPSTPTLKEASREASPPTSWQTHKKELDSLNNWQAQGRLAASNANKGTNASFIWIQRGDAYQIKLYGPSGSGATVIRGNGHFVELRQANGKVIRAQSAESLLKKVAGFQVPVNGLRYWLRGVPSPNVDRPIQKFNNEGYLKQLVQQGWHIDYENYQEHSPNLPNKLRLQNGNIKIKFVVTSWKIL